MNQYADIMRAEIGRTMNYGNDLAEECEARCPVCDSVDWDFMLRDCHGDIIGCEDCVTKVYVDEVII